MTYTTLLLTALLAQTAAPAPTASTYTVNIQKSRLSYTIVHKFHKVKGESKLVQGKAVVKPDGTLQLMVRAPVSSFESGDGNRDQNMRETMHESKYPYVVYKGVGTLKDGATVLPPKLDLVLQGELDFHGRKQSEKVTVHVESNGPSAVHATGHFVISLERYQVEKPSLLLIKIDDACAIDFELDLKVEAR
jgi:hypothetical protein